MGSKKQRKAEALKEQRQNSYYAKLNNCDVPPRKMRLLTEMIKGMEVNYGLDVLRYHPKKASKSLEKLLLSAISNWQNKNEGVRLEDVQLYIQNAYVDEGRMLKRIRPRAMGRANIIRKRYCNVTIILDSIENQNESE